MTHEQNQQIISGKNLRYSIVLNIGISVAQLFGGVLSGSMALITDAIHNSSDVMSLIISYAANKLSRRKATERHTFGYRRSEIIAAFVNSVTLIIIAIVIIKEAAKRFFYPQPIKPEWVIWLALASIIVNGLSVLFLRNDARKNLNIKSSYLHLLTDMMTSVAVLAGGVAMKYFHWYGIDAVFSILIAIYLLYMSWEIFIKSLKILMQFTPQNIDINLISKEVHAIEGIKNIHHIHIWQINEHDIIFEAHVDLEKDIKISDFEFICNKVETELKIYNIHHVNLQPEFSKTDSKDVIVNS